MEAKIYPKINPNDPRTAGEEAVLAMFANNDRFHGWTVFEEAHINSMKPDIVAYHPERGIIIIEIKDWDLSLPAYLPNGYVTGTNGKRIKKNPIQQVEHYKDSILKLEVRNTMKFSEQFSQGEKYYSCIETIVYFHNASPDQARRFCGISNHTKIWTRENLVQLSDATHKLQANKYTYALVYNQSIFANNGQLQHLTEELHNLLSYTDYQLERTERIELSTEQKNLAKLQHGSTRRWTGVAGSGKTIVLAEKAINALKAGQRVLIVTYNITLRHYIRDLCSQQNGGSDRQKLRSDLSIVYFHELLKTIMAESDIERPDSNDDNFTSQWIREIENRTSVEQLDKMLKYDTILIDEGQDFQAEWVHFLKSLYTGKGEFFVLYDKAQDLYEHGVWLEDTQQVTNLGFRGQPGKLRISYRIPKSMIKRIERLKATLKIEGETIEAAMRIEQDSFLEECSYVNLYAETIQDKIQHINSKIQSLLKNNNALEDITIITTNENTGAEIVKYFTEQGLKVSHVYDLGRQRTNSARRSQKWRFQGNTGRLKICSYHSYKGWETPNILLVLDPPTTNYYSDGRITAMRKFQAKQIEDALFISMSRIKAKKSDGSYNFTCLNYLPEYKHVAQELER